MTLEAGHETWSASSPDKGAGTHDRKFVTALARGLDVLRVFTPSEGMLGNREIAERTGLPKPTVSRLTYTLTKLGYLTHIERLGKYQIAPAALAVGYSALANMRIRDIARPYMQELADHAGASVALGCRDRLSVIYVEYCRSQATALLRLHPGSRIPVTTTAIGRALLTAVPEADRGWLFDLIAGQEKDRWPSVRAGIEQAIEDVATRGFTLSAGDWNPDVSAVGVPLICAEGIFAVNCGAPAFQMPRERLETEIGPRLVNVVRNVEAALGGR